MKVLFCHNFYQLPGGEDQVFEDECWLLQQSGHDVIRYEQSNHALGQLNSLALASKTLWNRKTYNEIRELVASERPDVVHFHNTFPLISPSGYYAAAREGAAIVQTLHNYRTICPSATLLRDHQFCSQCVGRMFAFPGLLHKCYRDSRAATGVTAALNAWQRIAGTRTKIIDRFIALTEYSRQHFVRSGLNPSQIALKPNFVRPDPGVSHADRQGAIFVGRLSTEKGVETLLEAWTQYVQGIPLKIVGDGPLQPLVVRAAESHPSIEWLGQLPFDHVLREIGRARVLVFPSCWAETFGRSMIEAFATGTPVVASDMASMRELVTDGKNGLHFRTGDSRDLAEKVIRSCRDQEWYAAACQSAREEFERLYSADANLQQTLSIYGKAIEDRQRRQKPISVGAS